MLKKDGPDLISMHSGGHIDGSKVAKIAMHSVIYTFLSSANEVSTGPTCQKKFVCLSVCLFVCLSVFPVFFSRRLIG